MSLRMYKSKLINTEAWVSSLGVQTSAAASRQTQGSYLPIHSGLKVRNCCIVYVYTGGEGGGEEASSENKDATGGSVYPPTWRLRTRTNPTYSAGFPPPPLPPTLAWKLLLDQYDLPSLAFVGASLLLTCWASYPTNKDSRIFSSFCSLDRILDRIYLHSNKGFIFWKVFWNLTRWGATIVRN